MRHNLLEAMIGAIVLVVAGAFLYFAYESKQKVPSGYTIYASFDRIDGLNVGSDVRVSGVNVGVVQSIELDPKSYQAKAALRIRKHVVIPADSSIEIASESLMGGKYVGIIPGGSEKDVQPNDVVTNTQSSVSFEGLIKKFLFSGANGLKSPDATTQTP
jgi:phospholipid/cholesterol/gamma-HCH transport system substrate-binding protein